MEFHFDREPAAGMGDDDADSYQMGTSYDGVVPTEDGDADIDDSKGPGEEPVEVAGEQRGDAGGDLPPPSDEAEDGVSPDPEGRRFLSFRQPFDGTQPEVSLAEQKAAGAVLSNFASRVMAAAGYTGDMGGYADGYVDEGEGTAAKVFIQKRATRDDPNAYTIELHDLTRPPYAGVVTYEVDNISGAARRTDKELTEDEYIAWQRTKAARGPVSGVSKAEAKAAVERRFEELQQAVANLALQAGFGLNQQPITLREAQALVTFLNRFM
ncbi:MAG TPA: hypothetical protein VFM05_15405 [Candidatus Saccharimonadales bacterium]|nr:hypothetical protein [Candidatus Saccharimonadales bacterium]